MFSFSPFKTSDHDVLTLKSEVLDTQNYELHKKRESVLNLFIWNTYKGKRKDFLKDFKSFLPHYDLFLLQEFFDSPETLEMFHAEKGIHWLFAPSFEYRVNGKKTGVSIGSRISIDNSHLIRGSEKELLIWTPKVSLIIESKKHNLLVINTHVVNFTTTRRFKYFIEELLDQILHFKGRIILTGDFNTWNWERWFYLISKLESLGFKHFQFPNDPRFLKLDHVFYKDINVIRGQILGHIKSSDHYPLVVDFELFSP